MKGGRKYLSTLGCLLAVWSCSVTRNLPPDSYMLNANKIETDKSAPREERISAGDLDRYVRQSPSKKLLGTNFPTWLYSQANPLKHNGWNNLLRRLGSEPVLLDTAQARLSDQNILLYMHRRGFYDAASDFDIRYRKRKATVTYVVRQGEPFRVRTFRYDFQDRSLEERGQVLNFSVTGDTAQICQASGRIADFCRDNRMESRQVLRFSLALEEIRTQIVQENPGTPVRFDVRAFAVGKELGIRFRYDGRACNPFDRQEEPGEAYLGIRLIAGMAEQVVYQRTFGVNTLQLLL